MKKVIERVAQAAEVLWLIACVVFLTPIYLVTYRRLLVRVGV